MYSTQTQSLNTMTSSDYHVMAAQHHEEAAVSHRNAAAHYDYGNYQDAHVQARTAKESTELAVHHCNMALK